MIGLFDGNKNVQQPKFRRIDPRIGIFTAMFKPKNISGDSFVRTNDDECSKECFEKAAKMVASTVKDKDNPKESLVFVYKDTIIYSEIGERSKVNYSTYLIDNPDRKVSSFHSHPKKTPASFTDYKTFEENPAEVIAYVISPDCEYYKFKKTGAARPSALTIAQAEEEYNEMFERSVKKRKRKLAKIQNSIDNKSMELSGLTVGIYLYIENQPPEERKAKLEEEIKQLKEKAADIEKNYIARKIHEFWLEHAQELGIELETNFSNLT